MLQKTERYMSFAMINGLCADLCLFSDLTGKRPLDTIKFVKENLSPST